MHSKNGWTLAKVSPCCNIGTLALCFLAVALTMPMVSDTSLFLSALLFFFALGGHLFPLLWHWCGPKPYQKAWTEVMSVLNAWGVEGGQAFNYLHLFSSSLLWFCLRRVANGSITSPQETAWFTKYFPLAQLHFCLVWSMQKLSPPCTSVRRDLDACLVILQLYLDSFSVPSQISTCSSPEIWEYV